MAEVARCEGRYPVPRLSPPREEPFEVTYRCQLRSGHKGPHGESLRDHPLAVTVEREVLVIRIGVHVLAHAAIWSDWANPYDETTGDYVRNFAITEPEVFADDVKHAMLHEREDGSTPLSDFVDKMSEAAVEDGSLGLHEDFNHRIPHGEKSPLETLW